MYEERWYRESFENISGKFRNFGHLNRNRGCQCSLELMEFSKQNGDTAVNVVDCSCRH